MRMNKKINKNREQYEIHSKPTPYISYTTATIE